jgi:hypothetical protein
VAIRIRRARTRAIMVGHTIYFAEQEYRILLQHATDREWSFNHLIRHICQQWTLAQLPEDVSDD